MRSRISALIALLLLQAVAAHANTDARAYVLSVAGVSVIDTATNTVIAGPIPVGQNPNALAVAPDGTRVYVTTGFGVNPGSLYVIDTATNAVVGSPVAVGAAPFSLAITPNGERVYVANQNDGTISVIDTATNATAAVIDLHLVETGTTPRGIAITPDGDRSYVVDDSDNAAVDLIDLGTNTLTTTLRGLPSPTGEIAVTPDGARVYVANGDPPSWSVIDTATNRIDALPDTPVTIGVAMMVRGGMFDVTFSPDSTVTYILAGLDFDASQSLEPTSVYRVSTATSTVMGTPLPVAKDRNPNTIAITPDGARLYATDTSTNNVYAIDTASLSFVGMPIPIGAVPLGIAIAHPAAAPSTSAGGGCTLAPGSNRKTGTFVLALLVPLCLRRIGSRARTR